MPLPANALLSNNVCLFMCIVQHTVAIESFHLQYVVRLASRRQRFDSVTCSLCVCLFIYSRQPKRSAQSQPTTRVDSRSHIQRGGATPAYAWLNEGLRSASVGPLQASVTIRSFVRCRRRQAKRFRCASLRPFFLFARAARI